MRSERAPRIAAAGAVLSVGLLVASGVPPAAAAKTIDVTSPASDPLSYRGIPATLKPGKYTFRYTNRTGMSHDLKVGSKKTPLFSAGTRSFTVTLRKGTVKYLCTVPGHAAAGMSGTILVR